MAIQIKRVKLAVEAVGKPFPMALPIDARIERAGISPTDGAPSLWYTTYANSDGEEINVHRFVVVRDEGIVEDENANHRGIWWEGDHTFHLYEVAVD